MKNNYITLLVFIIFIPLPLFSNNCQDSSIKISSQFNGYNKTFILNTFESIIKLNSKISFYKTDKNGNLINYFIFDLVDTLNFQKSSFKGNAKRRVYFKENHIYHFSSIYFGVSYSNIAILYKNKIELFQAINCKESKQNIESVIRFVNSMPFHASEKAQLIQRLRNYRKYGDYFAYDNYETLKCDCDPCN